MAYRNTRTESNNRKLIVIRSLIARITFAIVDRLLREGRKFRNI